MAAVGVDDDVPLLVRVLAGNPVTSAAIFACLTTADATLLRQLHPAVAGVVAGVPWCDMATPVADTVRWRAALPAAVGVRVARQPAGGALAPPALAALAGVMHLDLRQCQFVTDDLLLRLPPSLRTLNVRNCHSLTHRASFLHLTALTALDCYGTPVVNGGVAGLPPSLQEVDMLVDLPAGASLARLVHLRVLHAYHTRFDAVTLASLSPGLLELDAMYSSRLSPGASFVHLHVLHTLVVSATDIDDASLATLPPSLVSLDARQCRCLTPDAVLPALPALRLLDVSGAGVGDALVASLPAGLMELRMSRCGGVTAGATLDHVPGLQVLHSHGTELAPGVLDACRARGCAVSAASILRGHRGCVQSLALLGDGRLASGDEGGEVRVWDVAACGGEADMVWNAGGGVLALAALRDGHRLAAGLWDEAVEIWDVGEVPPVRRATVACSGSSAVFALVVLADGRLAAGCGDGNVLIVDADAGAVAATLAGHKDRVAALAVLPNGALVSGSWDKTVRVWDVGTQTCCATLDGHNSWIRRLAVLADGRLVSGSEDGKVQLWDMATVTCVGELTGHTETVTVLAALPDGRLASASDDGTLRVWDTRPAAAAGGGHAAGTAPMVVIAHGLRTLFALLPLPDGRLASAGEDVVQLLHVPPPAALEYR